MKQITPTAWLVAMGAANAILLADDDEGGLVLVDAGFPDKQQAVFDAIAELGRQPTDLKHLVFTHSHPDHIGSAAAIIDRCGASTWMHPADVATAESGGPFRPMHPTKRLPQRLLYRIYWREDERLQPIKIDNEINDGDVLPVAGGLEVIHTPGHSAGHVALLRPSDRLLMVGDVGSNMVGIADPLGYEDLPTLRDSQAKLGQVQCDAAAFGHGFAIKHDASKRLAKAWSAPR